MPNEEKKRQRLFLLRHGKPDFPDKRSYIYGHTDYPLAPVGVKQAKKLGKALSGIAMQRIVSSDLSRAAETADIVASLQKTGGAIVERDPSLREIHMGEWDGLAKEEVAADFTDIFRRRGEDIVNIAAPGGESFRELQARGILALDRILATSVGMENVLLVAHGGIFWSIVSKLFEIPLDCMFNFGLDYCALHLVEGGGGTASASDGHFRLIRYNWSPSLTDYMDDLI